MKKFLTILLCLLALTATAQKKRVMIPGNGAINVEQLNKRIDLNQDVSRLNLTEVRVLRNSFFARSGYPFRDAFLRGVFQCTSWYDSLMSARWEKVEDMIDYNSSEDYRVTYYKADAKVPMKTTKAEQDFIAKLQAREKELKKENFKPNQSGYRVNMGNILNAMQLKDFDSRLKDKLGRNGFAIVPARHEQLFHLYEQNDYNNFPNFVTTDLYLQLYHLYFDCLLRDVEQLQLHDVVLQLCKRGQQLTAGNAWLKTYFDVGHALITGQKGAAGTVADEVAKSTAYKADRSEYLGYIEAPFNYQLFRPRGHYARNDTLKQYFHAMMWLQTVPFGTDIPSQLENAIILAELTGSDAQMRQLYQRLFEPMTWLFGTPDNITILQVYDLMKGRKASQLLKDKKAMAQLRSEIESLAKRQTRIKPKFEVTSPCKINLLPQRYMPDSEVLQEMVDYDSPTTKRGFPKGLDVMAAMGVASAEKILIDEIGESRQWDGFVTALARMKQRMQEIDWQQTISTRWMDALKTLNETNDGYPYFMLTPEWQKKDLNAALASWAELKHDAILYAKQPFGAECGGGGPPEPVVTGYVEPNVKFWRKAISLLNATNDVLERYQLTTEKGKRATEQLRNEAEFLLQVSQKELAGKKLDDAEYDALKHIGATFENISLDLVRDEEQFLMGWNDVEGTDRKVALIADVYTANAVNNPERGVMYAAVGLADEIYCVVEVDGFLWLMRGAVLSYRETVRGLDVPRLTDEEWQKNLESYPEEGRPAWMRDIMVPLKEPVKTDERYFYSTGC